MPRRLSPGQRAPECDCLALSGEGRHGDLLVHSKNWISRSQMTEEGTYSIMGMLSRQSSLFNSDPRRLYRGASVRKEAGAEPRWKADPSLQHQTIELRMQYCIVASETAKRWMQYVAKALPASTE